MGIIRGALAVVLGAAVVALIALASCGDEYAEAPGTDSGASETGDGGAGAPCTGTFCDDFDRASAVGDGWDELRVSQGELRFETGTKKSGSRSLRASLVRPDGGGPTQKDRTALLRKDLPVGDRVTCSFQLQIQNDIADADRDVDLVYIEAVGAGLAAYQIRFSMRGPYPAVDYVHAAVRDDHMYSDGGCACPKSRQPFAARANDVWTRVTFVADFANGTASVTYDDAVAFAGGPFGKLSPTKLSLLLGLSSGTSGGPTVLYDDLECKVE